MNFLLNIIFAILAGLFTLWVAGEFGAKRQIAVILAILIGLVVFLANLAARIA